jgi:nucleotide-binding universal stress UspA family protein
MYDDILLPTDGSAEAAKATEHAIELAAAFDATVHALYVIDLPGSIRAPSIRDDEVTMRREYREYGEAVTREVIETAAEMGIEARGVIKTGSVHEEITEYARREGMDLIVMGSAYRGKFGALLGGTTERVVRTSTVPVTSIRMNEDD